jgi:uncharacterized membrane protein YfcA
MVAHSGGPPLAIHLLPLGMAKEIYAGTSSFFFTVGNAMKVVPWLFLAKPANSVWPSWEFVCTVPLGIWAGWTLHQRLDKRQLYRACYGLLVVASFKLLWAGVSGYWSQ